MTGPSALLGVLRELNERLARARRDSGQEWKRGYAAALRDAQDIVKEAMRHERQSH